MASAERGTQKRRSNFEELPEELQIEILCRVIPYKHLVRCKCVSKRWLSLISSYRFHSWTHMYMNKIRLKPAYVHSDSVVQDSRFKSKGFTLTFLPCHQPKKPIYVFNTLNGLFLCSATSNPHLPQNIYYVCNPLTMDWVALPSPPHRSYLRPYMLLVTVKLIHDGDDSERYQVVRVYRRRSDSGVLMVDIFSFEAKQWICRDVTLSVSRLCKWTSDIEINNGILYAAWSKAGTKMVVVVNLNSNDHHHHIIQLPKLGQPLSRYGGFRIVECRRRGGLRAVDVAFAEGTFGIN
ncbi:hypothetical protein RIF29_40063 [Crotalaria pallida]|uniref:F-box domain-containing protein n=1 Tax=Crotalaria pallida TaxID=3830 RepID=A0AAN9E5F9_CROPI